MTLNIYLYMVSLETIKFSYGGKKGLNQHNLNLKPTNKLDSLNHSIILNTKPYVPQLT